MDLQEGIARLKQEGLAKRVLIVEDDPVSALLLRRVLEHRGYQVDHAANGKAGLDAFAQCRHGIVISDWMMPEMDGVTFTRELRRLSGNYVYVVLLSAKGQRADRLTAFEAGVDDFLTKPLDRDDLFARLKVAERILSAEDSVRAQKEELAVAGERLRVANQNLLMASRRFEELFTGMPVPCFTFDEGGVIHEWNRAAEELFERKSYESLMVPVWRTFEGRDAGFWSPEAIRAVFQGRPMRDVEWTYDGNQGNRNLVANVFALRSATGEIVGAISANLDITERAVARRQIEKQQIELIEANERLETLAVTDGLTGLWNHRRFREELEKTYGTHSRKGWPLSLIFLDVDHFKQFNDGFGHPAGDVVLKDVARVITESARSYEAVGRYGGEEFAIILPGANIDEANAAAERFRAAIETNHWPHRAITASLGVATMTPEDQSASDLISRADLALYASKHAGRNCCSHYDVVGHTMANSDHLAARRPA